jgi:alkylation response protein AidB-like acyl-CoA dehydrogenase
MPDGTVAVLSRGRCRGHAAPWAREVAELWRELRPGERGTATMQFELDQRQAEWRQELDAFLDENVTRELIAEIKSLPLHHTRGPQQDAFHAKVVAKGWTALTWPEEYGGLERGAIDLLIAIEAFGARGVLLPRQFLAGTIIQCGTEANKKEWLPGMRSGEIRMVLGYSEPDSGTDLASLKTRAVRDGDEWVISGQKIWNSGAHLGTHEWLAVRTNPDVPNRQGISLIIVPIDSPGVSIQEIKTWGDYRTNIVFFDDVRVPYGNLIGEVDQGWRYITDALEIERVSLGVPVASKHVVEVISDEVLSEEHCTAARAETVIRMQAEYEVARLLAYRAGSLVDNGYTGSPLPQMSKVFTTEMRSRIGDEGMDLLRDKSLFRHRTTAGELGEVEFLYRNAPFLLFGGGANEVMRDILFKLSGTRDWAEI